MNSNVKSISVQIMQYVDDRFPGFVECEFEDADGRKHKLIDKVLLFTNEQLDSTSSYPQPGFVRCEILNRTRDDKDRELVRITLDRPDVIESTEGVSEFVLLSTELHDDPWPSATAAITSSRSKAPE